MIKNSLEAEVSEKLTAVGINNRPTKGSGNKTEIGDNLNNCFFIECKQKHTKANIVIDRKIDYLKLKNKMPINSKKEILIVTENKFGEKFVTMEFNAFFRVLDKINCEV